MIDVLISNDYTYIHTVAEGPGSSTTIVFQAMTMILAGRKKRISSGILGILETSVCER